MPPRKRARLACSNCSLLSIATCDGTHPCSTCIDVGIPCVFQLERDPEPKADTVATPPVLQHFPEPVRLSCGVFGSARLVPVGKDGTSKRATRFEWEEGATQRQDLRIRSHPLYEPLLVFPGTNLGDDEAEELEREGTRLDTARDKKLHANANTALSNSPVHPIVLLNAVYESRAYKVSPTVNMGNCLSIINSNGGEQVRSHLLWRRNTGEGRPTRVGIGKFQLPGVRDSSPSFPSFAPSFDPLFTDTSPIIQITSSPLSTPSPSSLIACRTATSLNLLRASTTDNSVLSRYSYTGQDLGQQTIFDVALNETGGGGMVVDRLGGLWGWGLGQGWGGGGKPEMFRLRRKVKDRDYAGIVKVVYGSGGKGNDAVVAFENKVLLYDLRSPKASLSLLNSKVLTRNAARVGHTSHALVTSLCNSTPQSPLFSIPDPKRDTPWSPIHTICTTREVTLVDERMPGSDLLSWEHGRVGKGGKALDHSLSLLRVASRPSTESGSTVQRVVLHSRNQSLITVYTYSSDSLDPPRSLLDPYALPPPLSGWLRTGLAVVPADSEEANWLVMESGSDGSVYSRYATLDGPRTFEEMDPIPVTARRTWSGDIEALADRAKTTWASTPALQSETHEHDFRPIYAEITRPFSPPPEERDGESDDNDQDRVQKRLELVKDAVVSSDGNRDKYGVFTMFDLMSFRSIEDASSIPTLPRPTSFIPSHSANPLLAPKFLREFEVPLDLAATQLSTSTGWSASFFESQTPRSKYLRETLTGDLLGPWERLTRRANALTKEFNVTTPLAEAACRQVVLDTNLASRVYAFHPIVDYNTPPEITNEPFPPEREPLPLGINSFTVEDPEDSGESDEEDTSRKKEKPSLKSLGPRMVLSEWAIGSDPAVYRWKNPYTADKGKEEDERFRPVQHPSSSQQTTVAPRPVVTRFNPIIEEEPLSRPWAQGFASQPDFGPASSFSQSHSQPFPFGGSQTVPATFGGRKKDKTAKKRVSGF